MSMYPGERRTNPRHDVHVDGELRRAGDNSRIKVTLLDIGANGARMIAPMNVREGERLYLTLPVLGLIEATVIWVRTPGVGLRFARTIHPAMLDHLRRRPA